MFSGIINYLGKVKKMIWNSESNLDLTINFLQPLPNDLKIGESLAINGACMTIIKIDNQDITVHVMYESLQKTNLGDLKKDDIVNCEFAITAQTRLNGHFVTGHIDTTIDLIKQQQVGQAIELTFLISDEFIKYIVYKGSVAINGVSLTIANVDYQNHTFQVCLIPHTQLVTNLLKQTHQKYNLECDILLKTLIIQKDFIK